MACVSSSSKGILARLADGDPSPDSSPSSTVLRFGATDICRPELVLVICGAVGLLLMPGILNELCTTPRSADSSFMTQATTPTARTHALLVKLLMQPGDAGQQIFGALEGV